MPEISMEMIRKSQGSAMEVSIRGHRVTVDRPAIKGGTDMGPMGGELFLAGLGGCFLSNFLAAAKARNLDAGRVTARITGNLVEHPPRFDAVDITVFCPDLSKEDMDHLVIIAKRSCIVGNTVASALPVRHFTKSHLPD